MNRYVLTVSKYYSHDTRKYHTIHLVQSLIDLYNHHRVEFREEYPTFLEDSLFQSIAWQNSVFIPGFKYNIDYSADLYLKESNPKEQLVYQTILSTKNEVTIFKNPIEKILHDLNWSMFHGFYNDLIKDQNKIFYEETCDHKFTLKQVKYHYLSFYKSIVDKDIYVTNTFGKYNVSAKDNLRLRIDELEDELKKSNN